MAKKKVFKTEKQDDINHDDSISFERVCAIYGKSMRTLNRWQHNGLYSYKVGNERYTTHAKLAEFFRNEEARKRSA